MKKHTLSLFLALTLLLSACGGQASGGSSLPAESASSQEAALSAPAEPEPVVLPDPPEITADRAIVIDYDTGETLYEKDADSMGIPASMTKVMTAYIIFEELEAGNLTLDTLVPVSAENAVISRDMDNYPAAVPLAAGSSLPVDTLPHPAALGQRQLHRHGRLHLGLGGGLCPADERDGPAPGHDGGV